MECNCTGHINHPFGNPLYLAIDMTLRTVSGEGNNISETDEPFVPGGPVRVILHNGARRHTYDAEVSGSVATILDESKLPIGTYGMELLTVGRDGMPYRCKYRNVLTVVDYSEDAGIYQPVEFQVETKRINATFSAGGNFTNETDPTVPKHVKAITQQDIVRWNDKQDKITDLAAIRAKAKSAVQDPNYVHTDNNYSDCERDKVSDLMDRVSELETSGGGGGSMTSVKVGETTYDPDPETGVVDISNSIPDTSSLATKSEVNTGLSGKVDKETGKQLSTEDYTTAEKTKLAGLSNNYNDLDNKPTIPSSLSQMTGDSTHRTVTDAEKSVWSAKQDALTFDNAPTAGSDNPVKSKGVKTYIDGKATIVDTSTNQDGAFTITLSDGNSYTFNLNHTHPQYLTAHQSLEGRVQSSDVDQIVVLADEAAYTALATKDSSTLYLIPESAS